MLFLIEPTPLFYDLFIPHLVSCLTHTSMWQIPTYKHN